MPKIVRAIKGADGMRIPADCMLCLINREMDTLATETDWERKTAYTRELLRTVADCDPDMTTPQVRARMDTVHAKYYGTGFCRDYAALKREYNELMLTLEGELRADILAAPDPLAHALRLARVGNYIDYGAGHAVSQEGLLRLLRDAGHDPLDANELTHLRGDLSAARTAAYLTDNCGEIVADKLLLERLQAEFPSVRWTVIVRGAPVLNDATAEDAALVGLDRLARVVDNGTPYPGTVFAELGAEASAILKAADVLIAKGQANFETLHGCGLNLYFLLLCKCDFFVRRFAVPRLTPMFVNESRLELP